MAEWSVDFEELAKRSGVKLENVVRGTCIELFSRVILRSPVDTGRFRSNWACSYNSTTSRGEAGAKDKTGRAAIAAMKGDVLAFPVGGVVYLLNSTPYASVLEYGLFPNPPKAGSRKRGEDGVAVHVTGGYSMQAPYGMVRITVREFVSAINTYLNGGSGELRDH